jgi:hypothetical protein
VTVLLETLQQFRQAAAQQSARAGAAHAPKASEIPEQAAEAALLTRATLLRQSTRVCAGSARTARVGASTEHLRELVPVLKARNRKKAQ